RPHMRTKGARDLHASIRAAINDDAPIEEVVALHRFRRYVVREANRKPTLREETVFAFIRHTFRSRRRPPRRSARFNIDAHGCASAVCATPSTCARMKPILAFCMPA